MKETPRDAATWAEEVSAMRAASCLFHSFSDPSRLVILRHLQLGEHRVIDLTEHLGLSQSTVSKHLASLKETGLVVSRPEGRASIYSLQHPEAIDDLFAAAETFLDLTGDSVKLCSKHALAEPGRAPNAS
ncbi:winged helix-turn-helix transcriptional regulator [Leucobacter sp. UCMA 4100]|uniref:ArsR/SmtB family transcription factor n=1 Tax=Leucobacter TaxID=55968 RepID=UPI001C21AB24|nr:MULTISPECIES: metalloregulator ArsR/SmtB family transcription factor [Leucobacter]MDA3146368.1 winged helix-turn-helix transcriptional regulator [Leucobacter sp. UCMA 4100]